MDYFENISESSIENSDVENLKTIENNAYEQNDLSSSPFPIVGNDVNETNSSSEIYNSTSSSPDSDSSI